MRKVMYMIMLIVVSISFDSCTNVSEKQSSRDLNCNQEVKSEYELERERLDSIIKDRKDKLFEKSIFAGIKFGDSKSKVLYKLNIYKRTFGNAIFIDSCSYKIETISYEFYKNRLHTLEIQLESDIPRSELKSLFGCKYGETKGFLHESSNVIWEYKDVIIEYDVDGKYSVYGTNDYGQRVRYVGPGGKIYDFQSYYGTVVYKNTAIIEEENRAIQEEREREWQIRDSIRLKKKIVAKQLSSKQYDNI